MTLANPILRPKADFLCCFGLDWSMLGQATNGNVERAWDSVSDLMMIGSYTSAFASLHENL